MKVCASALALALACAHVPSGQVLRSGAEGVTVDVAVTRRGRAVPGLTAGDFELTDNGVRQTILSVDHQTLPLDVTLIADMGGGGILQSSVVAGVNAILASLGPADRARLVTFSGAVVDRAALGSVSRIPPLAMTPGTHDAHAPASGSVLFDALAESLPAAAAPERRQMIILFTTGRDTGSAHTRAHALDAARRSTAAVFVVHARLNLAPREEPPEGATLRPIPTDPHVVPDRFFRDLAESTGGTVQLVEPFTAFRHDTARVHYRARLGHDGLTAAFRTALEDFRAGYVLHYSPQGVERGGWHEIAVRVTRGRGSDVRARRGYFSRT